MVSFTNSDSMYRRQRLCDAWSEVAVTLLSLGAPSCIITHNTASIDLFVVPSRVPSSCRRQERLSRYQFSAVFITATADEQLNTDNVLRVPFRFSGITMPDLVENFALPMESTSSRSAYIQFTLPETFLQHPGAKCPHENLTR